VVGLLAVAAATSRSRRQEVAVLRAVGLPPGTQGRARAAELLGVGIASVLCGVAAGAAVGAATIPGLVRASLGAADVVPARVLGFATADAAWPLAILVVGLVAVAVATGARVVAQAHDGTYREEVR
jgi:ABC-type antimicrobial peptide transport system permease subunit